MEDIDLPDPIPLGIVAMDTFGFVGFECVRWVLLYS